MRKYLYSVVAIAAMSFAFGCGNTTKESEEATQTPMTDSTVGNSNAANTIYRDSADIKHATESGGGTGNPASMDSVK